MTYGLRENFNQATIIAFIIIFFGSALRINVYFQNRSLIIDESNLARNIVEKDYNDFFKPLDYEQYSPPLYSISSKALVQIFGTTEYSFRILSLIAGIYSLFLLLAIVKSLKITGLSRFYVLIIICFSSLSIRYSTEFKQYAFDTVICLQFIYWSLTIKNKNFDTALSLKLALFGIVAIWFSMPVVFVLATMALIFLYRFLKNNNIKLLRILLISICWSISFGIYLYSILWFDATSEYLQNFHSQYFFNFFPTDLVTLNNDYQLIISLFRSATDKSIISIIGSIYIFIIGSVYIIKKRKYEAALLLVPIILCLIASHFKLYSLLPRLTLFMIPLIVLIIGIGINQIWNKSNLHIKILLIAFMLISIVNKKGYKYFTEKMEFEDTKSGMEYLTNHRTSDDLIYVHHSSVPAFIFYNQMHKNALKLKNYHLSTWKEDPKTVIPDRLTLTKSQKFYLFHSHMIPEETMSKEIEAVNNIGTMVDSFRTQQCIVELYELK